MRGHIRRRGQKWVVVVDVGRDENGRRRQQWHSGFETKRDAAKALTEILGRLQGGTYIEPSRPTLASYLPAWLDSPRATPRPTTRHRHPAPLVAPHLPRLAARPCAGARPSNASSNVWGSRGTAWNITPVAS